MTSSQVEEKVAVDGAVTRPLRVARSRPEVGPGYWRWDCRRCGEYGGGADRADALGRALRHCAEHPEHPSALLPPLRCRARPVPTHPVLRDASVLVVDDGEASLPVYPLPGLQRQGRPVTGRP